MGSFHNNFSYRMSYSDSEIIRICKKYVDLDVTNCQKIPRGFDQDVWKCDTTKNSVIVKSPLQDREREN